MKTIITAMLVATTLSGCILSNNNQHQTNNKELETMFEQYYQERLQLFPLDATTNGDARYNDKLYADFTDSYRKKLTTFYSNYAAYISKYDREQLSENDKISFDIFKREMDISLQGLAFADNLMPLNQFYGKHLELAQLGSGQGSQPFNTVKDYENWIVRASSFESFIDSAIVYFKKGVAAKVVLPKTLVLKIIPQCKNLIVDSVTKSIFWQPVAKMPATFSANDKQKFTTEFTNLIQNKLMPTYKKLATFLETEYLPNARLSSGINEIANGDKLYSYLIEQWTTTKKTPTQIYETGLQEVARIKAIMETIKTQVEFKGDLHSFFTFMSTDKQFMPYKTPQEVIDAFKKIQTIIDPNLKKMFGATPKTKFEIRQTEAFREASASAEYVQADAEGTRPGIFYTPIPDATKFNTTSGMESLFLHEAIPGHHYQISIQQENKLLPKFRRFSWYGAYGEGWALYTESLGKELGLYTNPYQHMGALGDEMLRAVRLVVDVALHTGKMTREQAIDYLLDNIATTKAEATSAIERYMAIPAQALSYKVGALKIKELREKYTLQKGNNFSLTAFHDEFLKDGCLPLDVLENKMNDWAKK
jgi:uncharacterized protein (DUF885 family)